MSSTDNVHQRLNEQQPNSIRDSSSNLQLNNNYSSETNQVESTSKHEFNCTVKESKSSYASTSEVQQKTFVTEDQCSNKNEMYSCTSKVQNHINLTNTENIKKVSKDDHDNANDSEDTSNTNEFSVKANVVLRNKSFEIKNNETTNKQSTPVKNNHNSLSMDEVFNEMQEEFISLGLVKNNIERQDYSDKTRENTFADESSATITRAEDEIPQRSFLNQCMSELESCIITNNTFTSSTTDFASSSFDSETLTVEQESATETETETKTSEYDHFVFTDSVQPSYKLLETLKATQAEEHTEVEKDEEQSEQSSSTNNKSFFLTECTSSEGDEISRSTEKRKRNRTIDYHDLKSLMWEATVSYLS